MNDWCKYVLKLMSVHNLALFPLRLKKIEDAKDCYKPLRRYNTSKSDDLYIHTLQGSSMSSQ